MEVREAIETRRSIRNFTGKTVGDGLLEILKHGNAAPSSGGSQPWEFIKVNDPAILSEFAEISAGMAKWFFRNVLKSDMPEFELDKICQGIKDNFSVPDVIAVISKKVQEHVKSTFCCVQNILLSATEKGYGVQIISPMGNEEKVQNLLHLQEDYQIEVILRIGKPAEREPQSRMKEPVPIAQKIHEDSLSI